MNQVINVTGKSMPAVGLGLWKIDPDAVADAVYQSHHYSEYGNRRHLE